MSILYTKDGVENMGGIIAIHFGRADQVASFPNIINGLCQSAITFNDGYDWIDSELLTRKAEFNQQSQETDQGILHVNDINIVIPKYNSGVDITNFMQYYWIARITKANGDVVIVGFPGNHLKFGYSSKSGRIPTDRNEISYTFNQSSPNQSPFYPF